MDKRFWAIIGILIIGFGGILLLQGNDKAGAPSGGGQPTNHIRGEGKKNVTLVEYGDFQCPVCSAYYPVVEQVFEKYKSDITFQFRNLPLTQVHQNAFAASRAAEAASAQGKFWEMYNLLYQNQSAWSKLGNAAAQATFEQMATQLGLNMSQFKKDFASSKVNSAINADIAAFNKTGRQMATPTFFLDGKAIENDKLTNKDHEPKLEKFFTVLDEAVAKKNQQ
ncbi:MAG TPA: thioredoxin domain-containing protein [Nevskiaceae bacterium]|nr:thioredoxin domain-containing protein [Nevskiaceae bacterium]